MITTGNARVTVFGRQVPQVHTKSQEAIKIGNRMNWITWQLFAKAQLLEKTFTRFDSETCPKLIAQDKFKTFQLNFSKKVRQIPEACLFSLLINEEPVTYVCLLYTSDAADES